MPIIPNIVVAETGWFASGRGQFTPESLSRILTLMRSAPLPCYYGHDAVAVVGRLVNPRRRSGAVLADLETSAFAQPEHLRLVEGHAYLRAGGMGASLELCAHKIASASGPPLWLPFHLFRCAVVPDPDSTKSLRLEPRELEEALSGLVAAREREGVRSGLLRIEPARGMECMVPAPVGRAMTVRELYERGGGRLPAAQQVVYGPKAGSFV